MERELLAEDRVRLALSRETEPGADGGDAIDAKTREQGNASELQELTIPWKRGGLKVVEGKPRLLQEARVRMVKRPGWGIRYYPRVNGARTLYAMVHEMQYWDRERLVSVFLNSRMEPIAFEISGSGGTARAAVDPGCVVRTAFLCGATAVAIAHNHPSGDPSPSAEDERITQDLGIVLDTVGIRLVDHIIVGRGRYLSFADKGIPLIGEAHGKQPLKAAA